MEILKAQEALRKRLRQIFGDTDTDGNGKLTLGEVEQILGQKHTRAYLQSLGIDANDAWTLLKLLDADNSGTIDCEEFIDGFMALKGEAKALHIATLAYDQR